MSDMKRYIELMEQATLNERLLEIDDDIDRIYDKFFRHIIDAIHEKKFSSSTEFISYSKENMVSISLDELIKQGIIQSNEMIMLAEKVPNSIFIFNDPMHSGAMYIPKEHKVMVSIHLEATLLLIKSNYDFDEIYDMIPPESFKSFKSEFTEEKMKGSIHHEIAHFYDNVMHGRHIESWFNKRYKTYDKNISTTKFEIEGMIHTIKQFKKKIDDWDSLTFDDMVHQIPSVNGISTTLKDNKPLEWEYWKRKMKHRMAREGILGNNMR